MRVLLDTDVSLDFVLERQPFFVEAKQIFLSLAQGAFTGYLSAVTPINIFYVARKEHGAEKTRQAITDLLTAVEICQLDEKILREALASPISDFEDATQHGCAIENNLDALVTRNLKDYKNATLAVYSPTDFLAHLKTL